MNEVAKRLFIRAVVERVGRFGFGILWKRDSSLSSLHSDNWESIAWGLLLFKRLFFVGGNNFAASSEAEEGVSCLVVVTAEGFKLILHEKLGKRHVRGEGG